MATMGPASILRVHRLAMAAGAVAATCLAVVALLVLAGPAEAQDTSTTDAVTTTSEVEVQGESQFGNILPRPNSGRAPDSANDPGGWQQYMVFALIGLGLLGIVALATRESRRIRRAQGRYPD